MNLGKLIYKAGKVVKASLPTALSFLGVGGVVATAVISMKMARKIDEKKVDIYERDEEVPEKAKDMIKEVTPLYLPIVGIVAFTIACVLGSDSLNSKYIYTLSEGLLGSILITNTYRDKIREKYGPEEEAKIYSEVLDSLPHSADEEVEFFDPICQFHFKTTWLHFMEAQYELNRFFGYNEGRATLYDFYSEIPEIRTIDIPERAKFFGWTYDMFLDIPAYWIDYQLEAIVSDTRKFYRVTWSIGPINLEYDSDDILGPWEAANGQLIFD